MGERGRVSERGEERERVLEREEVREKGGRERMWETERGKQIFDREKNRIALNRNVK